MPLILPLALLGTPLWYLWLAGLILLRRFIG
mgnify:CR=1 FL=1